MSKNEQKYKRPVNSSVSKNRQNQKKQKSGMSYTQYKSKRPSSGAHKNH